MILLGQEQERRIAQRYAELMPRRYNSGAGSSSFASASPQGRTLSFTEALINTTLSNISIPEEEEANLTDNSSSWFRPESLSLSPNGDVVIEIDGVPERLPVDGLALRSAANAGPWVPKEEPEKAQQGKVEEV